MCPPGHISKEDQIGCRIVHDTQTNVVILLVVFIICFVLSFIFIKLCPNEFKLMNDVDHQRDREKKNSGHPYKPRFKLNSEEPEGDDTENEKTPYGMTTPYNHETENILYTTK